MELWVSIQMHFKLILKVSVHFIKMVDLQAFDQLAFQVLKVLALRV